MELALPVIVATSKVDAENAEPEGLFPDIKQVESKLKSMTQGKGTFTMSVDHLDVCPPNGQDEVIKDRGFKVEEDEDGGHR